MTPRDLAAETATALDANRGRSLLTVLGIVIGIAAVIAMTSLIGGIRNSLVGELGLDAAKRVNIYAPTALPRQTSPRSSRPSPSTSSSPASSTAAAPPRPTRAASTSPSSAARATT